MATQRAEDLPTKEVIPLESDIDHISNAVNTLQTLAERPGHGKVRSGMPLSLTKVEGGMLRFRRLLKLDSYAIESLLNMPGAQRALIDHQDKGKQEKATAIFGDPDCRIIMLSTFLGQMAMNVRLYIVPVIEFAIINRYETIPCMNRPMTDLLPTLDEEYIKLAPPKHIGYIAAGFKVIEDLNNWNALSVARRELVAEAAWAVASLAFSQQLLDRFCDIQPELTPYLGKCASSFDQNRVVPANAVPWREVLDLLVSETKVARKEHPEDGLARILLTIETVKQSAALEIFKMNQRSAVHLEKMKGSFFGEIDKFAAEISWFAGFAETVKTVWNEWIVEHKPEPQSLEERFLETSKKAKEIAKDQAKLSSQLAIAEKELKDLAEKLNGTDDWKEKMEFAEQGRDKSNLVDSMNARQKEIEAAFLATIFPSRDDKSVVTEVAEEVKPAVTPQEKPAKDRKLKIVPITPAKPKAPVQAEPQVEPSVEKKEEVIEPEIAGMEEPIQQIQVVAERPLLDLPMKKLAVRAAEAAGDQVGFTWANLSLALLPESAAGALHAARVASHHGYPAAGEHLIRAFALGIVGRAHQTEVIGACQDAYLSGTEHFHGDNDAVALMAVAAGAAPALLFPETTDIMELLRMAPLPAGTTSVYNIVNEICDAVERKIPFDHEIITYFEGMDEARKSQEEFRGKLQDLLSDKHYINMSYVPAKRLMQEWLGKKGMIGSMIGSILDGSYDPVQAEAFAANMMDTSYVEHAMDVITTRMFPGRTCTIDRSLRRSIIGHCHKVGYVTSEFLRFTEEQKHENYPFFVKQMDETRSRIQQEIPAAVEELKKIANGEHSLPIRSAAIACSAALSRLPQIMRGVEPVEQPLVWDAAGLHVEEGTDVEIIRQQMNKAMKEAGGFWKRA